jgi:hypothetical protein
MLLEARRAEASWSEPWQNRPKSLQGVPFLQHHQDKDCSTIGLGTLFVAPVRNVRLVLMWPFVAGAAFVWLGQTVTSAVSRKLLGIVTPNARPGGA